MSDAPDVELLTPDGAELMQAARDLLEDYALLDMGYLYIEAAKARKCNTPDINFTRIDSEGEEKDWHCWLPLKKEEDGTVTSYKLDHRYYLDAPFEKDLEANYQKYAELD